MIYKKMSLRIFFLGCLLAFPEPFFYAQEQTDRFAQIGTRVQSVRFNLLREVTPAPLPEVYLPVIHRPDAVFEPVYSMNTPEELYDELDRLRERYKPFMKNLAPSLQDERIQVPLDEFLWREETSGDCEDFEAVLNGAGEWEKVKIPHYGPPLGRAVTYYFRTFEVNDEMLEKGSLFICFKGVDYKAHVFINGYYVGSHEGFFAPFEFLISKYVRKGQNKLLIKVENDFTTTSARGNKIYGATGPGYDDPEEGWHHCPAGMGIYQDCYIEARDRLHIRDIFVRPLVDKKEAEVWLEVNNYYKDPREIKLALSVYGQNFDSTVIRDLEYIPHTVVIPGVGDLAKPTDWEKRTLKMGYGVNFLKVTVDINNPRLWKNDSPWLYQLQVKLFDEREKLTDTKKCQFGMRSFTMDTVHKPKGRMFLNGEMVRLRGANTMGVFQQDVMRKDWDQLQDDILLAKILGLNFIRMTQRPVQPEIYDYCDRLGMMTQTDLPLFGSLRTNQWAEAVRQAGEMEKLVRGHPCNIMVTYINERFPNAEGEPQRSMSTAAEYYRFFKACDQAVHMANPDRVIKAGDGDYDPPSPGLPDNHCYNAWYNGHGLELGKMHKGYWQWVKPGWYYACGEFGAEGLDNYPVMEKYYPKSWLPQNAVEEKTWNPGRIPGAQTQKFHYMWFNAQHSVRDWIEASQNHQAWATRLYTEAFRRDSNMMSFAIHLFIDAWPAGWMKTIMDVDRQPKKAFFVYRDLLKPLIVMLRTDRFHFFSGDEMKIEAWLANDRNTIPEGYVLKYQFLKNGKVLFANEIKPDIPKNSSRFQGYLRIRAPQVNKRTSCRLILALFDDLGEGISQSVLDLDVFPKPSPLLEKIYVSPSSKGTGRAVLSEMRSENVQSPGKADAILIDHYAWYDQNRERIDRMVKEGKTVIFLELPPGKYRIAGTEIIAEKTNMGQYYFASPVSENPLVSWAKPLDFRFWYDASKDYVTPFLGVVFKAQGWTPVLTSGNPNWKGDEGQALAVADYPYGKGLYRICQIGLQNRLKAEPVANKLFRELIKTQ